MGAARASLEGAETPRKLAKQALGRLLETRGAEDHPALYSMKGHPWTDHFARIFRDEVDSWLAGQSDDDGIHVVAARWRAFRLLQEKRVRAGEHPLYDTAWRSYPADGGQLLAQRLIAECVWKGGWPALARGCDRLAQARADLKLIMTMDDPDQVVGDMTLAQACAFRISAFAPAGDPVMLAFYGTGGPDSWRQTPGFTLFSYVTGEAGLVAL